MDGIDWESMCLQHAVIREVTEEEFRRLESLLEHPSMVTLTIRRKANRNQN
jgi:hypothetical protein